MYIYDQKKIVHQSTQDVYNIHIEIWHQKQFQIPFKVAKEILQTMQSNCP